MSLLAELRTYIRNNTENTAVTVGDSAEDFDNVTDAIAHAQKNEKSRVLITDNYDAEGMSGSESYPIAIDPTTLTVEGENPTSCGVVVPQGSGTYAFDLEGSGSGAYNSTHTLRNLYVKQGGIRYAGECYLTIENVICKHPETDAIHSAPHDTYNSFSNKIANVKVLWGDGDGVYLDSDAANNGTHISDLTINRVNGDGAVLSGAGTVLRDSDFNYSGRYGVRVIHGQNVAIRDSYVEKSGHKLTDSDSEIPTDVRIEGGWNVKVENLYCFSFGTSKLAVDAVNVDRANIDGLVGWGYSGSDEGLLALRAGADRVDVNRNSHSLKDGTSLFVANDGTNTLSHGLPMDDVSVSFSLGN